LPYAHCINGCAFAIAGVPDKKIEIEIAQKSVTGTNLSSARLLIFHIDQTALIQTFYVIDGAEVDR